MGLFEACEKGNLEEVRFLLEHVTNVNRIYNYGQTALFGACYNGHIDVVRLLIQHGANVNQIDYHMERIFAFFYRLLLRLSSADSSFLG